MVQSIRRRTKEDIDRYLADWYIGVSKRRGWDVVVDLLAQYPQSEAEMKLLIKKRLGK